MKYRIFLFLYIVFLIIPAGYAKDSSFANILHEIEHAGFTVRHHQEGASDKTIVLIEDAHTNYPAQKELARIIEHLTAATAIQVIAVEGSEGEILTHFFASFPIDETRRRLADNLLKNGFISGEEYLSISSGTPIRIVGVDDRTLYKHNIEYFRDFYHARAKAHPLIDRIQNGLFQAKVTLYDNVLFKFDTACLSFKDGSVDLTHFLEVCEHLVPDADKLFFDFPLLNDVRIIAQENNTFNFDTLYEQAARAAKLIIQHGTAEQANTVREALLKNMAGKTAHASFYRQLIVQAESNPAIDISGLSELKRYVALSEELGRIDHETLQSEIDGFIEACYQRLLSTAEEKELHALSSNFETLNHLYSLSLVRSDYLSMHRSTQISEFVESFTAGYNKLVSESRISPDNTAFLAKILANNLAFYRTAVQRDTAIFENTLSLMEQQQCAATILIAGGFHKGHIIASCAERQIGCIVISPATAGEQDFDQYASVVLRNDRLIQPPLPDKTQGNYLRASSFFAQSSFDSAQHITAFRNNFIFEAVLESIGTIGAGEIHSIIKAWRSGFLKALSQHHPENSATYQNAVSIFDYLVTDVFAAGNIEAHPESNTVILFSMGQTLKISRTGKTGVSVEPIAGHYLSHELEKSFALISDPLVLRSSEVFIAGWVITDEQSPYKGHGDAHYAVKFIEALNLRGITPAVIIPFDSAQRIATIKKYLTALSPQTHQFQFITYNEETGEGFHAVDTEGTLLSSYMLSPERRPIVLDLASSIDPGRNQRLETIQHQILQTYSMLQTTAHQATPAIIITTPDTPFYDTLREIAQTGLQNATVFVSAWVPADDGTPEVNEDLLPNIARIITYLNQRGIVPRIPIPSFSPLNNKARRAFIQQISRHLTPHDRVQYVAFDEFGSNTFIDVDTKGILSNANTISAQTPLLIVHSISDAEPRNDARLEQITEQIQSLQSAPSPATQFKPPLFIRIPTAGTVVTLLDGLDIVNVHMASSPRSDEGVQSLKTGFMADAELLALISRMRAIGKPHFRRNTILEINDLFEQRIQSALEPQTVFSLENIDSYPWSFHYLTEKSDAELASFMKAAVRTGSPQVIFTFYRNNSEVDIRHKTFLKQHFKFLDLQQQNNDALDTDSPVLVINLPPLSSGLFKALMASADTATVSGENSLLESLALNKFGVGPLPLFRPAIAEHLEILRAPLTSQTQSALLEKTLRYAQLDDAQYPDALSQWDAETPASPVENDLIAALGDPETQLFWKSVLADIVAPVNGLNTLTAIIGELDRSTPVPDIVTTHNHALQSDAYALADAFIDSPLDHTSAEGQKEFIESAFADFVKSVVMNAAKRRLDASAIRPLLNTAVRHIVNRYNHSLYKLSPLAALQATQRFEQKLYTALAGIDIVGKGHLFMPFSRNDRQFYSYSFVDFNPFHPDPALRGVPVVHESTVVPSAKQRIAQDIVDAQYVKSFLSFITIQDALSAQYSKELPHTFTGTSDQIDRANDFIARTAVPLFRQTAQENDAVLTEHYGTASVAALYAYYFDFRSSMSLSDPGDNALIDRLTRITATLYQTPFDDSPTFFFRGNESGDWLSHMEDNLQTLIAQKTALNDFTLTARSIGASVGKEPYTQATIIQNALRRFARSSVYTDTRIDRKKRNQLVEQWVDSWDVRIYAFERSFQRSITTQAGVYRILPQEHYFFMSPDGQNYISLFENGQTLPDPKEEFQRQGVISQRLKNWVIPVLSGDLSTNPRILAQYPAEITFMMNMLTYLANDEARMNLYRFALDSSSTAYRSFVMYNETFDAPPSNHFILDGLPYTIPPLTIPLLSHIDAVSQIIHSTDKTSLSSELGVYTADRAHRYTFEDQRVEVQIAGTDTRFIETGQFYSPAMLDGIVDDTVVDVYLQLYRLVSSLPVNPGSPEQTMEEQQRFATQQLPEFLRQFILFMIDKGLEENIIRDYIADTQKILSSLYSRRLLNTPQEFSHKMLSSWNDTINSIFGGIEITDEFDIFIPIRHDQLFHLEYGVPVFNKNNPADDSVTVVTHIIPAHTKSKVISDSRDTAAIAEILQLFAFDEWFTLERFPSLRASWSKTPEMYQSNPAHSLFIRDHVAASLVPSFNLLVQNYAGLLATYYGNATLGALHQFIEDAFIDTSLLDDPASIGSLTPDTAQRVKLAGDIRAIIERLRDDREEDGQPSVTGFFRPASGWNAYINTVTGYFSDLILQKTARNDYSITIKDIGASTGKEALSIAAMLEESLLNYARRTLFASIADDGARNQAVQSWVDRWDIRIYAFEQFPARLVPLAIGEYDILHRKEVDFFVDNPDYFSALFENSSDKLDNLRSLKEQIDTSPDDILPIALTMRIKSRLLKWVIPVASDIRDIPELALNTPAEATFFLNAFYQLGFPEPLLEQLKNTAVPHYKSLFLFNRRTGDNPDTLGNIAGQDYVLPAQTQPSLEDISAFITTHHIYSAEELNRIFGTPPAHLPAVHAADNAAAQLIARYRISGSPLQFEQSVIDGIFHDALAPLVEELLKADATPESIRIQLGLFKTYFQQHYFVRLSESRIENVHGTLDVLMHNTDRFIAGITMTESGHVFIPVPLLNKQGFDHIYVENQKFKQFLENRTTEFLAEQFDFHWSAENRISGDSPVIRSNRLTEQAKDELIAGLRDRTYARTLLDGLDFNALFKYHIADSLPRNFIKGEFLKPGFDIPAFSFETDPETAGALKEHLSEILLAYFKQLAQKHAALLFKRYNSADIRALSLTIASLRRQTGLDPAETALLEDYNRTAHLLADPYENGSARRKQNRFFSGKTRLFRKFEVWYKQYDNYLYDVIAQKAAAGDLTFRISSIGSSIGKEPYSLASLLERKLIQYARQNVFKENPDDPRIQEWIDSWDIKVYAYDHSLQRLATSREGFYALDGKIYNHTDSDLDFFAEHPAFLDMFSAVYYPEGNRTAAKAQTANRLQRWVHHRYLDLESDLSVLQDTPTNVVFFMNVYPNLSEPVREDVLKAINRSLNLPYKSFFSYNTEIIGAPVEQNDIPGQPFVVAASTPPPLTLIETIRQENLTFTDERLARYFGLNTADNTVHPHILFYNRFITAVRSIHAGGAPKPDDFKRFIETDLPLITSDYIAYRLGLEPQLSPAEITQLVNDVVVLINTHYEQYGIQQFRAQAPELTPLFARELSHFAASISLPVQEHVLIPYSIHETQQNRHIFIDSQPFHIDPALRGTPAVINESLNITETARLQDRLQNIRYVRTLLDTADIEINLQQHIAEKRIPPTFALNSDALKDALTSVLYGRLKELAKKHAQELERYSFKPTLEGLSQYYSFALANVAVQDESPLLKEFADVLESVNADGKTGTTWFFRHGAQASRATLDFLRNLVAQKATRADNTISLRSVGSSTGQEAYAMASMVERALTDYAQQNLYPGNPQAVQDWINNWTVNIYAIDSVPIRHIATYNGVYTVAEQPFKIMSDISEQLNLSIGSFEPAPDGSGAMVITVPERFKLWVKPITADFGAQPEILKQYPAEVTYLNNILPYVPAQEVVGAAINSSNPRYMSYVNSDEALSNYFPSLERYELVFPGSRGYSVPPKELPAILNIMVFADTLNEWDENNLFTVFGLDESHREFLKVIFEIHDAVIQRFNTIAGHGELFARELLESFAQNDFPLLVRDLIHSLLAHQESSEEIKRHITYLVLYTAGRFRTALDDNAIPNAQNIYDRFFQLIKEYAAVIAITDDTQVFLPIMRDGSVLYQHYFIDFRPFHPREELRNTPVVASIAVSETRKNRIIEETQQAQLVLPLLENDINFTELLGKVHVTAEDMARDRVGFFPFYSGNPRQIGRIKRSIAQISIGEFKQLQNTHRKLLEDEYGDASLENLVTLLALINSNARYLDIPRYSALLNDYLAIIDRIKTIDTFGYTEFFRQSHSWLKELESFLDDLIREKAALGDYTITAKSIGSSYGKELISIGGVIEKRLVHYAQHHLFTPAEPASSERMQAWLDRWDVTLQAYDMSYLRMASMMQGVFLESIVGYETGGYEFLRGAGTEYATIFSTVHDHEPLKGKGSSGDIVFFPTFSAVINPRILSWIQAFPVNLQKNPEIIAETPAEIMFSMNVMWYFARGSAEKSDPLPLEQPQLLINAIHNAVNPQYKAFAAYNGAINSAPKEHRFVSGQKYVLPPAEYPDADVLFHIISSLHLREAKEISRIMGFSLVQDKIFTALFRTFNGFIASYFNPNRLLSPTIDTPDSIEQLRRLLVKTLLTLSQLDISDGRLNQHLEVLAERLIYEFSVRIAELVESGQMNAQTAQNQNESFSRIVQSIADSIVILPEGNLLIPSSTEGYSELFYVDRQAFSLNKTLRGSPATASYLIQDSAVERIRTDIEDIPAAIEILTFITGDFLVLYPAKDMPQGYDAMNSYNNGQHQQYLVNLAKTYLSELRRLAALYADELADSYGTANLGTLYELIKDRNELFQAGNLLHPIINDIARINASIQTPDQEYRAYDAPAGFFFQANWWVDDLSEFLAHVIAQKNVRNDLTLTVRSVGSSTGEEAYSIAAVIEKALRDYAQSTLFSGLPAESQQQKTEQWIDRWHVEIHLYDSHPYFLASSLEGIYTVDALDAQWIEQQFPDFAGIIEERDRLDDRRMRIRIKPRLRNWMHPHLINLNNQTPPHKAEITVAMNSLMFLGTTREDSIIAELMQTRNPLYKSYFLYNRRLQMEPEPIDEISGQPFTVQPQNPPDFSAIDTFIQRTGISSEEQLTLIFGLTEYQRRIISSYTRMLPIAEEFLSLMNEHLADVIQHGSFDDHGRLLDDAQTEHNRFMELISPDFFPEVVADLLKQRKSSDEIYSDLAVFSQILIHRYHTDLLEAHHPLAQQVAAHFQTGLSAFLSSIEIENGSFFIPDASGEKAVVREYAVDWRAFYPDETLRSLPRTVHIATLTPEQVPARIKALSDISAAKRILELNGFIDFPAVFDLWDNPPDDTVRNRVGFLPFYDGSPTQNETLKNHVAELALDELKTIAADFSGLLPKANTPVLSLAAYLSEIGFNLSAGTYPAEALPVVRRMETLRDRIVSYDSIGYTEFFRNAFYWHTSLSHYLQDILAQKTARNDLTLAVKSIGASYGKEAYSIAALIAYELAHYARFVLFAGNPDRDVLTREWVDSWDISIYAFEKDYQKLVTLQEGVYLIKGSDVNYTDYHTLLREMPGFIDLLFADSAAVVRSSYSGERGFASIVNRRLKKWVVPVPADLGTDEGRELVKRYPAEIVFAMNILPYFNPATTPNNVQPVTADTPGVRELLGAIDESFNPHYKSFFMYDLDGLRAVGHTFIQLQEFSLPPRQFPSFEAIHATAQQTGADSAGKLRSIMGITNLYADVFNAYFNLRPHLEELIHTFSTAPSFQNDFASVSGQNRFIETVFSEFLRSYTMQLAIQQLPSNEISAQLAFIPMLLSAYYQEKLAEQGIENAAELRDALRLKLHAVLNRVVFVDGHVFIETPFETDTIYEHRYIDYHMFHPDPEQQGKPVVVSEYISQRKFRQLTAELDDIPSVIRILDTLDFDRQFNFAAFELRLASGLNIAGAVLGGRPLSRNQLNAIKQSIATASLDFFRTLAGRHASELTQRYGQASLQTFAQYLAGGLNTPQTNQQIKTAIELFSNHLYREQSYGHRNTTASETYFFRDPALFDAIEEYLEELILAKIARNDYRFSLRSLGSSTGQEAVTLAVLTHSVLQKFARKLYDSATDRQKWIARWDYTVYAIDIALPRFLPLKEGTYSLESLHDISVFHTKPDLYDELFAFHSHSIAELGKLYDELNSLRSGNEALNPALPYQQGVKTVVSPAIRNRIQVIYGDLRNNPGLFTRTNSNLTLSMNLLALFGFDSEIDEQQTTADQEFLVTHARASSEPSYKGFFAFNTGRNSTAEHLNETPNQPQAIPPVTTPSLSDIRNAVKVMERFGSTATPETVSALFGITEAQSSSVSDYFMLNEQAHRVIENIADVQSEHARQRAIEDILAPFSIDYVTRLLPQSIYEDALFERLVFFTELLVDSFRNAAAVKHAGNTDALAVSFERQIIAYMNTFELSEGHLFIKTAFEGVPLYEHRYVDMQLFHPDPAIRNTARIVREFVSQEKRRDLLKGITDAKQVTAIFDLLDFDANFSVSRFSTDSYYAPAELSSSLYLDDRIADQQQAAVKHGLAVITTRFFRGLSEKYADRLTAFAGTADLRALFLYLEALNTRKVQNNELLTEIMNFQDTLYQDRYYYTEYSYGTGAGTMFLDLPPLRPNLENYVRDLVIQKMARGDFSFSLRSLGASSGREALVLTAVADQVLNRIAEQLYHNSVDREKWIARWNYTVYANDLIPVRMLPLITGNYLVDNTDEVRAFLDNPDFYQSLFIYRSHTADDLAEIHQAFMRANESRANDFLPLDFTMPLIRLVASPHLLNRIAFYSGSIENNPHLYEATRGNATVLMNTLLYLSEDFPNITPEEAERQLHIVRQLDANTDSEFKSFFMVNNDQPDPVILDFFPHQPYVKPPVRIPSFDVINRTAEVLERFNQEVTADTLARIIGLTQDNAHIAETYIAFRNGAREAFETLFAHISGVSGTAEHGRFIHSTLRDFAVQFSMQSIISGTPADTVESYLDILPAIGKSTFIKAIQHFGLQYDEQAADAFADAVQRMIESLEIHAGDIFVPTSIDGRPAYIHYFIEQTPSHPLTSLRTPHSASELIPAALKKRILQDTKDVELARTFYTEATDRTIGRENAYFIIDYLRMLSIQFEETIFSATGATGIDGLTAFTAIYRDEIRARMQETDPPLIREIKQFVLNISHGTMPWQRGDAYVEVSAETYFFRHQAYWTPFIETVQQTVSDLIARQIAAGDYSLRLESIGASTGKEAYSLAAITENALRSYAEKTYRGNPDMNTLVEQWLDSWDIQITAMDKSLSPLAIAKNGVYLIESVDEVMHLINDFPHMLSYSSAPLQDYTNRLFKKEIQDFEYDQVPSPKITVAVSNRLKRWVRPLYGDVLSNPRLLEQSDAQVSVYMNTHRHLIKQNAQQAHKIMEVLSNRTNTRLKRLVIMNDEFDVPPEELHELEGHPYIKPPSEYPTATEINAVAVASGIFSEHRLADIFGITVDELVMILDEALTEIIPGALVDKLRWNREYTDSML